MPRSATGAAPDGRALPRRRALRRGRLDGLIVTGAEPRSARPATDEPYWDELTSAGRLGAGAHRISTIWSCLAAHAAVLHLDGIERQPLPVKLFGVFACRGRRGASDVRRPGPGRRVPHSRCNDLPEGLLAAGYQILTRRRAPASTPSSARTEPVRLPPGPSGIRRRHSAAGIPARRRPLSAGRARDPAQPAARILRPRRRGAAGGLRAARGRATRRRPVRAVPGRRGRLPAARRLACRRRPPLCQLARPDRAAAAPQRARTGRRFRFRIIRIRAARVSCPPATPNQEPIHGRRPIPRPTRPPGGQPVSRSRHARARRRSPHAGPRRRPGARERRVGGADPGHGALSRRVWRATISARRARSRT